MADQELGLRLKTDSDVPAAMGKAQSAVVSFDKQVQDVQKKFSTAFKDIFLGFTAPMVIIQSAIQMISSAIDKAKQDAKEGLDLIAKGETVFATTDEAKMARFLKAKEATEKEAEQVEAGRRKMTETFLTETVTGKKILQEEREKQGPDAYVNPKVLSMVKDYQDMALQAFLNSEEGKKYAHIFEAEQNQLKAGTFKGPEGFSNVVGVGANPVMEAMAEQLEEQRKQTALLEKIASPEGGVPKDFTKDSK
jgi:hypothetical protein